MTLANSIKPMLRKIRGIAGELGLRPHRAYLVDVSFTGAHVGEGQRSELELELTENGHPPKIRWLKDDELALGNMAAGTVEIGPITADDDGATTIRNRILAVDLYADELLHVRIVGPAHPGGARYRVRRKKMDRAMHYKIQAEPVA